jgi:predicted N-formylglutamate amidohydrolase
MVDDALAQELMAMTDEDRRLQAGALGEDFAAQLAYRRVTVRNGDRLAEILDEHGWPTHGLVGPEAARRAWLVAQHADRQLPLQRRALALMTEAVGAGDADPAQLAMLRDRLLVNEGRPQIYGTQIAGVVDGAPVPWPCEDPENVDRRRAEMGLEPFAVHVARHAPG